MCNSISSQARPVLSFSPRTRLLHPRRQLRAECRILPSNSKKVQTAWVDAVQQQQLSAARPANAPDSVANQSSAAAGMRAYRRTTWKRMRHVTISPSTPSRWIRSGTRCARCARCARDLFGDSYASNLNNVADRIVACIRRITTGRRSAPFQLLMAVLLLYCNCTRNFWVKEVSE